MNFIDAPYQSASLSSENIRPPNAILNSDLSDPALLGQKRTTSIEYQKNLKRVCVSKNHVVTTEDLDSADTFRMGAEVASLMPSISAQVPLISSNQMQQQMQQFQNQMQQFQNQMQNQMHQMQQQLFSRLDATDTRFRNFSATRSNDPIYPIITFNVQLPNQYPGTRGAVFSLTRGNLDVLLQYYALDANGTIDVKRKRLALFLGLPNIENI